MSYNIYLNYVPPFKFNTRDIKKFLATKGINWSGMINCFKIANKGDFTDPRDFNVLVCKHKCGEYFFKRSHITAEIFELTQYKSDDEGWIGKKSSEYVDLSKEWRHFLLQEYGNEYATYLASSLNQEQQDCYQEHRTRLISIMLDAEEATRKARKEYDERKAYLASIEKELDEYANTSIQSNYLKK